MYHAEVYDRWSPEGKIQRKTDRQGGLARARAFETPTQRTEDIEIQYMKRLERLFHVYDIYDIYVYMYDILYYNICCVRSFIDDSTHRNYIYTYIVY